MNESLKKEYTVPATAKFSGSWTTLARDDDIASQLLASDKIFNNNDSLYKDANVNSDLILNNSHSSSDDDIQQKIEELIGRKIHNVYTFKQAFIHKSMQKKHSCSNERLEFLGDSVLNLAVADYIYHKYGDNEGVLTKIRTKLVNKHTLSYLAQITKLDELIITSKQINLKNVLNDKILEDAFEAFIGALYEDQGFLVTQKFIIDLMENSINFENVMIDDNYKDILLRYSQKHYNKPPEYVLEETQGPAHKKYFKVYVLMNNVKYEYGEGNTKKAAEQHASKLTLEKLHVNLKDSIKNISIS